VENLHVSGGESPKYNRAVPHVFIPQRVIDLMDAKTLTVEQYLAAGFKRDWIHRKARIDPPKISDAIDLAHWLNVPVEYLFGAAPEYDNKDAWEVASRASLDFFLRRHPERTAAKRFRMLLEDHVDTHQQRAPRTASGWAVVFDAMAKAARQAVEEYAKLERSAASPGAPP